MTDGQATGSSKFTEVQVPIGALVAAGPPGPLSPIWAMAGGDASGDRPALDAVAARLPEGWTGMLPALVDPGRSLGVVVSDGGAQFTAQYVWQDPSGFGPAFQVSHAGDSVTIRGAMTADLIELGLRDVLSLGTLDPVGPWHLEIDAEGFWALAALLDAASAAWLLRRAARLEGRPAGLAMPDVQAAWSLGHTVPNAAWLVAAARLVAPDLVPRWPSDQWAGLLSRLEEAGHVVVLGAAPGDNEPDQVMLGETVDALRPLLGPGQVTCGILLQSRLDAGSVQALRLVAWRSVVGMVCADLGGLAGGRVDLVRLGPGRLAELLALAMGPRDTAPQEVSIPTCPSCGQALRSASRFCPGCGKPVSAGS